MPDDVSGTRCARTLGVAVGSVDDRALAILTGVGRRRIIFARLGQLAPQLGNDVLGRPVFGNVAANDFPLDRHAAVNGQVSELTPSIKVV